MFAVIKTGGKQYRVAEHDVIRVEKLAGEAGDSVELGAVLMLGNGADAQIGAPLVEGARVVATILEQARAPKILVFKKKRRKNYRRTRGHRQDLTVLRVTDILSAGDEPKTSAKKAAPAPKAKAAPKKAEPKKTEDAPAKAKAAPKKAAPKKAEDTPVKAKAAPKKAAPKKAEDAPAKAKAAPKAKSASKTDGKASAKAKSAPKKTAATKAPAKTKSAAKPKAKTGKTGGKEKA